MIKIGSKIIPKNPFNRLIRCCSCRKYYDFKGNVFLSNEGNILICPYCKSKHKISFTLINKKMNNLTKINKIVLATAITIGGECINRGSYWSNTGYTLIDRNSPADGTGKITTIEIWCYTNMTDTEVATFYLVGGNYSTRDHVAIGTVIAGEKRIFNVDLEVEEGDFIGIYSSTGYIEIDTPSGDIKILYKSGDNIPCTEATFGQLDKEELSLHGIGTTPPPAIKDSAMTGIYTFKTLK